MSVESKFGILHKVMTPFGAIQLTVSLSVIVHVFHFCMEKEAEIIALK